MFPFAYMNIVLIQHIFAQNRTIVAVVLIISAKAKYDKKFQSSVYDSAVYTDLAEYKIRWKIAR